MKVFARGHRFALMACAWRIFLIGALVDRETPPPKGFVSLHLDDLLPMTCAGDECAARLAPEQVGISSAALTQDNQHGVVAEGEWQPQHV